MLFLSNAAVAAKPSAHQQKIEEALVAQKPSARSPETLENAMNGTLSFLRSDYYQQGPQKNDSYRPWMAPATNTFFSEVLGYGLFSRKFEENSTRVIETARHGSLDDYEVLSYLPDRMNDSERQSLLALMYFKSYNNALGHLKTLQDTYQKKGVPLDLVAYDRGQLKVVSPDLTKKVLSPFRSLDKLLLGKTNLPPVRTAQDERDRSDAYHQAMLELLDKGTGPASFLVTPSLLYKIKHTPEGKSKEATRMIMVAELQQRLDAAIFSELMPKAPPIPAEVMAAAVQPPSAPLAPAPPQGHGDSVRVTAPPAAEAIAPVVPTEAEAETPEKQPEVTNAAPTAEEEQAEVADGLFELIKEDIFSNSVVMRPVSACLSLLYENMMTGDEASKHGSADEFLTDFTEHADHCYNQTDGDTPSTAESRAQHTQMYLAQVVAIHELPNLRARALSGLPMDAETDLRSKVATHFSKTVLIPQDQDEAKDPEKSALFNPTDVNFWVKHRQTGAELNHKYGISFDALKCNEVKTFPHVRTVRLVYNPEFMYSRCPSIVFDKQKFLQSAEAFMGDEQAVIDVYNFITNYGSDPAGIKEFTNLLMSLEFQRRNQYVAALNSGKVTGEYKPHPLFSLEDGEEELALGKSVGIGICLQKPAFALSPNDPCGELNPDVGFATAIKTVQLAGLQSMNIVTKNHKEKVKDKNGKETGEIKEFNTYQVNHLHAKDPTLRDPMRVGNNVFSIDTTRNNQININDEYEYHRIVRDTMDSMNEHLDNFLEASGKASGYWNNLKALHMNGRINFHNLTSGKDKQITDRDKLPLTEANMTAQLAHENLISVMDNAQKRMAALGLRVQNDGIYANKQYEEDEVDPETGKESKVKVVRAAACREGLQHENLQSPDAHTSNTALYQRQMTCFMEGVYSAHHEGLMSQQRAMERVRSDAMWNAALFVTLPVGGLAVGLTSAALRTGGAVMVRGGVAAYRTGQTATAIGRWARFGQGLNSAGRFVRGSAGSWNTLKSAGQAAITTSEASALRTASLVQLYGQGSRTMGMGVGFMKGIGVFSEGIKGAMGKHKSNPDGSWDVAAQTLFGGQDIKSLGTIAGMMVGVDTLAFGTKNLIVNHLLKSRAGPVHTVPLPPMLGNTANRVVKDTAGKWVNSAAGKWAEKAPDMFNPSLRRFNLRNPIIESTDDQIALLRKALPDEAIPQLNHGLDKLAIQKAMKMGPTELAGQTAQVQEYVFFNRVVGQTKFLGQSKYLSRPITNFDRLLKIQKSNPAAYAAERAAMPLTRRQILDLKMIDRYTTQWANHLGADLGMTSYFQFESYKQRAKQNDMVNQKLEAARADLANAREQKHTDAEIQKILDRIESLESTYMGKETWIPDLFIDAASAVAFRHARPGDFGQRGYFEAHQFEMDRYVSETLKKPNVVRQAGSKVTYTVPKQEAEILMGQLMRQEERFHNAVAAVDPQALVTAPHYAPFIGAKNADGSFTLTVDPNFKAWRAYRFRDYVPADVRAKLPAKVRELMGF